MTTAVATVGTPEPSSAIEQYMAAHGGGAVPGLEDVGPDDVALPIIKIDHAKALFVDSLTGETHNAIEGVLLGILKQRVLWDVDMQNNKGPMCRSRDAKVGDPTETFPWERYHKLGGAAPEGSHEIGCDDCSLAQWGSHPSSNKPWCSLQYTFPVVYPGAENVSGLVTFQRAGIAPSKQYLSGFVRDRVPIFAFQTKITLDQNKTGTVDWCAPKFERGAPVLDTDELHRYERAFYEIKRLSQGTNIGDSPAVVPPAPQTSTTATSPVTPSTGQVIEGEVVDSSSSSSTFSPLF